MNKRMQALLNLLVIVISIAYSASFFTEASISIHNIPDVKNARGSGLQLLSHILSPDDLVSAHPLSSSSKFSVKSVNSHHGTDNALDPAASSSTSTLLPFESYYVFFKHPLSPSSLEHFNSLLFPFSLTHVDNGVYSTIGPANPYKQTIHTFTPDAVDTHTPSFDNDDNADVASDDGVHAASANGASTSSSTTPTPSMNLLTLNLTALTLSSSSSSSSLSSLSSFSSLSSLHHTLQRYSPLYAFFMQKARSLVDTYALAGKASIGEDYAHELAESKELSGISGLATYFSTMMLPQQQETLFTFFLDNLATLPGVIAVTHMPSTHILSPALSSLVDDSNDNIANIDNVYKLRSDSSSSISYLPLRLTITSPSLPLVTTLSRAHPYPETLSQLGYSGLSLLSAATTTTVATNGDSSTSTSTSSSSLADTIAELYLSLRDNEKACTFLTINTTQRSNDTTQQLEATTQRPNTLIMYVAPTHLRQCTQWLQTRPEISYVEPIPDLRILNNKAKLVTQDRDIMTTTAWQRGLTGRGEVVIVGDTGVDLDHCMFYDPTYATNNHIGKRRNTVPVLSQRKIVWYTTDYGDLLDNAKGHGTHVAGTIAGAAEDSNASTNALALSAYNGHAPAAKLVVIDFKRNAFEELNVPDDLYNGIFAPFTASVDAAISSHSWGGGTEYNSFSADVDRFVYDQPYHLPVFAAGNDGEEGFRTILSPGNAKNALTVGAAVNLKDARAIMFRTQDFMFSESSENVYPQSDVLFPVLNATYATAQFGISPSYNNVPAILSLPMDACSPLTYNTTAFASNPYNGLIVVVQRGTCSFVTKAQYVKAVGAIAMIVVNSDTGRPIEMGGEGASGLGSFSAVMIAKAPGETVMNYLKQSPNGQGGNIAIPENLQNSENSESVSPQSSWSPLLVRGPLKITGASSYDYGMADFSSRGPTLDGRVKPDISAPGQGIYSANSDGRTGSPNCKSVAQGGVTVMSGTSMATPAVSGNIALLREYFLEGFYSQSVSAATGIPSIAAMASERDPESGKRSGKLIPGSFRPTAAGLKAIAIQSGVNAGGSVVIDVNSRSYAERITPAPASVFQGWGLLSLGQVLCYEDEVELDVYRPVVGTKSAEHDNNTEKRVDDDNNQGDSLSVSSMPSSSLAASSSPPPSFSSFSDLSSYPSSISSISSLSSSLPRFPPTRLHLFDTLSEDIITIQSLSRLAAPPPLLPSRLAALGLDPTTESVTAAVGTGTVRGMALVPKIQSKLLQVLPATPAGAVAVTSHALFSQADVDMCANSELRGSEDTEASRNPISSSSMSSQSAATASSSVVPTSILPSCTLTQRCGGGSCGISPHSTHTHCAQLDPADALYLLEALLARGSSPVSSIVVKNDKLSIPSLTTTFTDFAAPSLPYEPAPALARATLVWTDPVGKIDAAKVLVHDLDLVMQISTDMRVWVDVENEKIGMYREKQGQTPDFNSGISIDFSRYKALFPRAFALFNSHYASSSSSSSSLPPVFTASILSGVGTKTTTSTSTSTSTSPVDTTSTSRVWYAFGNHQLASATTDDSEDDSRNNDNSQNDTIFGYNIDTLNNVEQVTFPLSSLDLNPYILAASIELGLRLPVGLSVRAGELTAALQHYALATTGMKLSVEADVLPLQQHTTTKTTNPVAADVATISMMTRSPNMPTTKLTKAPITGLTSTNTCGLSDLSLFCPAQCNSRGSCVNGQCRCSADSSGLLAGGVDCAVTPTILADSYTPCKKDKRKCPAEDDAGTVLFGPVTDTVAAGSWVYHAIPASVVEMVKSAVTSNDTEATPLQDIYLGLRISMSSSSSSSSLVGSADVYVAVDQIPTLQNHQYSSYTAVQRVQSTQGTQTIHGGSLSAGRHGGSVLSRVLTPAAATVADLASRGRLRGLPQPQPQQQMLGDEQYLYADIEDVASISTSTSDIVTDMDSTSAVVTTSVTTARLLSVASVSATPLIWLPAASLLNARYLYIGVHSPCCRDTTYTLSLVGAVGDAAVEPTDVLIVLVLVLLCCLALFAWYKLCCGQRWSVFGGSYTALQVLMIVVTCGKYRPNTYVDSETYDTSSSSSSLPASTSGYPSVSASVGNRASAGGGLRDVELTSMHSPAYKHPQQPNNRSDRGNPTINGNRSGNGNGDTYYRDRNGLTGSQRMDIVNDVVVMVPVDNYNSPVSNMYNPTPSTLHHASAASSILPIGSSIPTSASLPGYMYQDVGPHTHNPHNGHNMQNMPTSHNVSPLHDTQTPQAAPAAVLSTPMAAPTTRTPTRTPTPLPRAPTLSSPPSLVSRLQRFWPFNRGSGSSTAHAGSDGGSGDLSVDDDLHSLPTLPNAHIPANAFSTGTLSSTNSMNSTSSNGSTNSQNQGSGTATAAVAGMGVTGSVGSGAGNSNTRRTNTSTGTSSSATVATADPYMDTDSAADPYTGTDTPADPYTAPADPFAESEVPRDPFAESAGATEPSSESIVESVEAAVTEVHDRGDDSASGVRGAGNSAIHTSNNGDEAEIGRVGQDVVENTNAGGYTGTSEAVDVDVDAGEFVQVGEEGLEDDDF